MKNKKSILPALLIILTLLGCTVELDQPAATVPTSSFAPETNSETGLTGRLIYSTFSTENNIPKTQIQTLDLSTRESKAVFSIAGNAWIYYLAISPDNKSLLISYTPPYEDGAESYTSLYVAPVDQPDSMQLLFTPPTPSDRYTQVEWSPDGSYIYFVHYNFWNRTEEEIYPHYEIYRMAYPGGTAEKIIDQGFWPRLSADGSKLVYISLDAVTGLSKLFISDPDGSNPQEVALTGLALAGVLDAPIFTPDGQSVIFSAPVEIQSRQPNWLDQLFDVKVAEAHSVPSDWWSVSINGGSVTRLTRLQTVRLFASISPDQKHIASLSGDGIFVMDVDGANLTNVLSDPQVSGSLIWAP